jgi:hypothetical protein
MNQRSTIATWIGGGAIVFSTWIAFDCGTSQAYVRTRSSMSNLPLAWKSPCVKLRFLLGSRPPGLTEETFRTAVGEAAAQWSSGQLACTKMVIELAASSDSKAFVDGDRVNNVQFRTDFWGRNAKDVKDRVPYPANALAITSVFAEKSTGVIVDTDVEINAMSALWGDVVANPALRKSTNTHDLQNTLTHEFGHVIGLDHTCDGGGQSNMFDNAGLKVPSCPGSAEIQETTMAAIVMPGDTLRRTLAADDQKGVCEIYAADGVPPVCPEDNGGGCNMSSTRTRTRSSLAWAALGSLASLAFIWRRNRR